MYFFQYIGFLCYQLFFNWYQFKGWKTFIKCLNMGGKLCIPLILVAMLIGFSLTISINYLLYRYNLQDEVILISQTVLIRDIAPLLIGLVLCVCAGLMLIDSNHPSLHQSAEIVLFETTLPLFVGLNTIALLLYVYIAAAFHLAIGFTLYYFLEGNIVAWLSSVDSLINKSTLFFAMAHTIFYTSLASLIAGFYYYEVSMRDLFTQKAVSNIITRGLFWLVGASVFIQYLFSFS